MLSVSKHYYIKVCNQKPAGLAESATLTNITPPVTARTTSGKILGDQPEEGIYSYGRKILKKEGFKTRVYKVDRDFEFGSFTFHIFYISRSLDPYQLLD